jgi:hypothetical protein
MGLMDPMTGTAVATMAWRVAGSLDQLLAEINASAPNRSKASDGSIGDEAHQSTDSDHNPHCCGCVVTARDFTHDPNNGFDSYAYADWQRRRCKGEILIGGQRETRVSYIISNRRIASPDSNWAWCDYYGSNPHDKHAHVSVDCTGEGGAMDSTQPWGWTGDDDVSAGEVWSADVNPSEDESYTASGALWTCFQRTGYLGNEFAPHVNSSLASMSADLDEIEIAMENMRGRTSNVQNAVADLAMQVSGQTQQTQYVQEQIEDQGRAFGELRWFIVITLLIMLAIGGINAWSLAH